MRRHQAPLPQQCCSAAVLLWLLLVSAAVHRASACVRLTFTTADNVTLTGRIMDGTGTQHESIWVLPLGVQRWAAALPASNSSGGNGSAAAEATGAAAEGTNSAPGTNSTRLTWTSKYAVVAMVGGNMSLPDGMNEKGLVINHSRMDDTIYPHPNCSMPGVLNIHAAAFTAYLLDNFATVAEAVEWMGKETPNILMTAPAGNNTEGEEFFLPKHWSLSDPSGDSAIVEWIDGKLRIWHGKEWTILVNMPHYQAHLDYLYYWRNVQHWSLVPGSTSSLDRFARLAWTTEQLAGDNITAAGFKAVLALTATLRAHSLWPQPRATTPVTTWHTLWRSLYVQDPHDLTLYYDSYYRPASMLWLPLKGLNLSAGAPAQVVNAVWLPPNVTGDATQLLHAPSTRTV